MIKYRKNKVKPLILIVILFMFISMSNLVANAQTITRPEGFFGHDITVDVVTLSNGTQAWKWVSGEYSDAEKSQIDNYMMNSYNVFMKLYDGDATVKYNCHSYAWYSQNMGNQYWINDPYRFRSGWMKSTGWTDTLPSGIQIGDKVDYYRSDNDRPHSAVVYSVLLGLYASKWGCAGLYVHKPTEVPYGYTSKDLGYYRP